MSYKITLNLPNVLEGEEVNVDGLGNFVNGETSVIPDDILTQYVGNNGHAPYSSDYVIIENEAGDIIDLPEESSSDVELQQETVTEESETPASETSIDTGSSEGDAAQAGSQEDNTTVGGAK